MTTTSTHANRGASLDMAALEIRELVIRPVERATGLRGVTEHRFHETRRWRFDVAWTEPRIALEINGAIWTQGRHTRGKGYLGDMEKGNAAVIDGWGVLGVTWDRVRDGSAARSVIEAIRTRREMFPT